jgi:hypothetical protein
METTCEVKKKRIIPLFLHSTYKREIDLTIMVIIVEKGAILKDCLSGLNVVNNELRKLSSLSSNESIGLNEPKNYSMQTR